MVKIKVQAPADEYFGDSGKTDIYYQARLSELSDSRVFLSAPPLCYALACIFELVFLSLHSEEIVNSNENYQLS